MLLESTQLPAVVFYDSRYIYVSINFLVLNLLNFGRLRFKIYVFSEVHLLEK